MKKLITVLALALVMTGCATLGNGKLDLPDTGTSRLAVQYATLKVIEQADDIGPEHIIRHVERVRNVVNANAEISLNRLTEEAREPIQWDTLSPADKMLLDALIQHIEISLIEVDGPDVIDEEARVHILTLLDWVEQAAGYAR